MGLVPDVHKIAEGFQKPMAEMTETLDEVLVELKATNRLLGDLLEIEEARERREEIRRRDGRI